MRTFTPLMNSLPAPQVELWPELAFATDIGMTLYGGTAVALRLGHRTSVDFDFFTDKEVSKSSLFDSIPFLKHSTVIQDEKNTLSVLSKNGVKVSFFGGFTFGRYGTPDLTDDGVLLVASIDDLMGHKSKVVLDRAAAKDYTDIAEMIKSGVSLPRGLATARELFSPTYSPNIALRAMTYFKDGDLTSLSDETKQCLIAAAARVDRLPDVKLVSQSLSIPMDKSALADLRAGLPPRISGIEPLRDGRGGRV